MELSDLKPKPLRDRIYIQWEDQKESMQCVDIMCSKSRCFGQKKCSELTSEHSKMVEYYLRQGKSINQCSKYIGITPNFVIKIMKEELWVR